MTNTNVCKWCGKIAKYHFETTDTYCCSKFPQQCIEFKKKLSKAKVGIKRSQSSVQKQSNSMRGKPAIPQYKKISHFCFCDYGCGQKAKYQFKNGKVCCEKNYRSCPNFIKSKKFLRRWQPKGTKFQNVSRILCSYGCGKQAKYKFKNGKYCCEVYVTQCSNVHQTVSQETRHKLSKLNKKEIEYWKSAYPFFAKIEKLKIDKDGEILVQCKFNECNKFFKPSYIQLYERIRALERPHGMIENNFYCSQHCKDTCPLYNLKSDPYKEETENPYTQEEHNIWRSIVLEQDEYECQYCGSKDNLHCHHILPVKTHPHLALDPDNGITLCKDCHYEIGHKDECSTGNLANKQQNGCRLGNQ